VDTGHAGDGHLDGPAIWARVNEVDPSPRTENGAEFGGPPSNDGEFTWL